MLRKSKFGQKQTKNMGYLTWTPKYVLWLSATKLSYKHCWQRHVVEQCKVERVVSFPFLTATWTFWSLSYDRSIASSKTSAIQCFLFQLRASCRFHKFIQYVFFLILPSLLSFYFFFSNVFRKQFLRETWPIQLDFLPCPVCRIFLSSLTVCNTSFCTRTYSWSPYFSSTTDQNYAGICDHLSELS
jgi:hypothetical protein